MLPPPTVDSELMKTLTEEKDRVNPSFWSALENFKLLIRSNLAPKHSYNHGEYVTGEGNIIKSVKSELNFSKTFSYYGDMSRNACYNENGNWGKLAKRFKWDGKGYTKKGRLRRNNESREKNLKIIAKETPWKFGISMKTTNLGNLTKIRQRFVENSKRLQNGSHEKWSIWERFAEGWRKFKLHGKRPKLRAPWTVAILKKMVNFGEDSSKVGENPNERTKESGKWPL